MNNTHSHINHTTTKERIAYGSYFWGQNVFFFIVTMMLQIYLTNTIGLEATSVGVIFIIVKIWSAITDPILGVIIDRSQLKSGKFLPWIRLSSIMIPIFTVLLFTIPTSLSHGMKALWAAIAYVLWGTAYTLCDTPITGISMAVTDDVNERTNIISFGRLGALLAILGASFFMPTLASKLGYGSAVIILSIVAFLSMLPSGFVLKERFSVRSEKKISFQEISSYLKKNKFLFIFLLSYVLGATGMTGLAVMNYVAIYCLGGEDMQTPNMLFFYVPMVATVPMVMYLSKKIDKFYLYTGSYIVTTIAHIALFFIGYDNHAIYFGFTIIKGICFGFSLILIYTFVADATIYGTYKTKIHAEGISFSLQTFSQKMVFAISASLAMFILGASGYLSGCLTDNYPEQPTKVVDTIWFLSNAFNAIGTGITAIILCLFYKLRNKDIQLMSDVNNGLIKQEDAEKQLPKYI